MRANKISKIQCLSSRNRVETPFTIESMKVYVTNRRICCPTSGSYDKEPIEIDPGCCCPDCLDSLAHGKPEGRPHIKWPGPSDAAKPPPAPSIRKHSGANEKEADHEIRRF